ncbi:hypothetical protein [Streptomyces sp900105755]|uniref:Uncharacterized protein n=1 Tax=Streptomyces sp. 900105755 TaxID=3154389 RepID=A0ABV1TBI0_9ACTN
MARLEVVMVFGDNYVRDILGASFGGTEHSGYGREHAPETLRTYSKMIPFPTGLAAIAQWRAVTDIYGP